MRILIVDDDKLVSALKTILRHKGQTIAGYHFAAAGKHCSCTGKPSLMSC